MPNISVIVPVFNASASLAQCIESILAQSYPDYELILVDDGSTDDSPDICDKFAAQDSRVMVIHQPNTGVSEARNVGIRNARGEWLTFVDSDDIVLDCFLQSLITAISNNSDIDLAYCGYAIVEDSVRINTYQSDVYVGRECVSNLLKSSNLLYRCSPWAKLFRRSIIEEHSLAFDCKLQISEDRLFLYNYLPHVKGIATTSQIGYLYASFSPTSLKHKRVPTEMLVYRQEKMREAAHQVIRQFGLEAKGEAYLISRHLVLILSELIRNVYHDYGVSKKTVKQQNEIFDKLFDSELYRLNLEGDRRWNKLIYENVLTKYMLDKKFTKLNRFLLCLDMNLKLRVAAYNLLKKNKNEENRSFNKALTIINTVS